MTENLEEQMKGVNPYESSKAVVNSKSLLDTFQKITLGVSVISGLIGGLSAKTEDLYNYLTWIPKSYSDEYILNPTAKISVGVSLLSLILFGAHTIVKSYYNKNKNQN